VRPSIRWTLTAFTLALTGLTLLYLDHRPGPPGRSRLTELRREFGYPYSWWEELLWLFGAIILICCVVFAWLYWSTPAAPRREPRQFPMDPPGPTEPNE
jgi:hypothetical protein